VDGSLIDEPRRPPRTQFVLDHPGMEQPLRPPPGTFSPELDHVLALARHPNLVVKLTGVCTCSHRPFPYDDLWEPVGRLLDAFGIDRCLWGTDWQRATRLLSYAQSVDAFLDHWPLSATDRGALMAENTMRVYDWGRALRPA
jgi:predicted TIM-barrel fold metal-dependent hydrolase